MMEPVVVQCESISDDSFTISDNLSLISSANIVSSAAQSLSFTTPSMNSSSLILAEDPISKELTVCQYVLPSDLVGKYWFL